MRRYLSRVAHVLLLIASVACSPSPPIGPSPPVPDSPLKSLAGDYTLTIDIDASCENIPQPLRTRAFDVVLEDRGWHFMPILMARCVECAADGFGTLRGEMWPPDRDARYPFRWNSDCDVPEIVGATELYVCGDGFGTLHDSTISGVMDGGAFLSTSRGRQSCATQRFTLVSKTE